MIDKLDQLRDFAAWEHEYDPAPEGKYHISRWAIDEIKRLRVRLEWIPDGGPDGIDCRNETIKLQDENVKRLRIERDNARQLVSEGNVSIVDLGDNVDELEVEIEQLRACSGWTRTIGWSNEETDAERYRFLVKNCGYEITKNGRGKLVLPERVTAPDYLGKLSAAIDSTLIEDRANEAD